MAKKAAKKAPAKKAVAAKAAKPAAKAAKPASKPAAKTAKPAPAAKAKAAPAAKAPAKAVAPAKTAAPAKAPAKAPAAKPAKPSVVKAVPPTPEAKAPAAKAAGKKPELKVVEPKATPSLMSKVQKDEADSAPEETAAPKKKRSEKDPLAGLDKIADPSAKWEALNAKASLIPTNPYKMSGVFEPKTGLQHKVLGWGYVLSSLNDRLEVLFKDGVRILISNYKAP